MLELFAGEQSDEPDLEAMAVQWRDHGLHLVPRGGGAALTFAEGDFAGDPDAPAFELLRLANIGRLLLKARAHASGKDQSVEVLAESARWSDVGFVDLLKGRG